MIILFELDMMGKLPSRCKIRNQKIAKEKVFLSQSNWKLHLEEGISVLRFSVYVTLPLHWLRAALIIIGSVSDKEREVCYRIISSFSAPFMLSSQGILSHLLSKYLLTIKICLE